MKNVVGGWSDGVNWAKGLLPRSIDSSYIHTGTATIDSDVGSVTTLHMGYTGLTGTLDIVGGANLTVTTGNGRIGRSGYVNSAGVINMTGGTLTYGASQNERLIIGLDSSVANSEQGSFTISGGTFAGGILLGSTVAGGSRDLLRIEGDAATIGSANAVTGNGLEVRSTGDMEFIFDETGISTLSYANEQARFYDGSTILVDGSAYTGSSDTFTLINATSFYNTVAPTIVLTNFADEISYDYDWDTVNGDLTVTVDVPVELVPPHLTIAYASNSVIVSSSDLNSFASNTLQEAISLVGGSWNNISISTGSTSNSWVITPLTGSESFYRVISK